MPHYHKALLFACQGMVARERFERCLLVMSQMSYLCSTRAIFSFVSPNSAYILTMVGVALITGRRITGLRKIYY